MTGRVAKGRSCRSTNIRETWRPQRESKPPSHLGNHGKALWVSIAVEYSITDAAGKVLLTTAAECLDRMRAAQKLIAAHGECVNTGAGGLKTNPAIRIEHDSQNRMMAALRALSLDIEPLRDGPGRPAGTYPTGDR